MTALASLIDLLGDDYDFHVMTRNRDLGDKFPYGKLSAGRWMKVGKARVFYARRVTPWSVLALIRATRPAAIYCNSLFSRFTIWALLLRCARLIAPTPVVLAPRGELCEGAIDQKALRKQLFLRISSAIGFYRGVIWHATCEVERTKIASALELGNEEKGHGTIMLSSDVPDRKVAHIPPSSQRPEKLSGLVSLLFLSRIGPKKNLLFLLEVLSALDGEVELDLYGPVEDAAYWGHCQRKIRDLPGNIRVAYRGPVASDRVIQVFGAHHFQVLPTLSENFGYAILEALASGCPVLTSDRTPWRNLHRGGAGWDLPLEDRNRWSNALKRCVEMDKQEYEQMSRSARAFFEEWANSAPYREDAMKLFQRAVASTAE